MTGRTQTVFSARVPPFRAANTLRRASLVALLAAAMLTLGACSATRFAYNQLDWLIVWYIDDYFALNDEQREALSASVRRNLDWHRQSELPRYAEFCRRAEAEWTSALTTETLERSYDELIDYWDALFDRLMPDIAEFLLSLDDEQIDQFVAKIEENNDEMRKEYSGETPDQRLRQRQKAIVKVTERFVGRLSRQQRNVVRQYASDLHDNSEEWMAGRRIWQQRFTSLLRERPDDFAAQLRDIMLDPNQFDSADYRRRVDENRALIFDLYEVLLTDLSDRQRATLSRRLMRYAKNFDVLAAGAS